MKNLQPMSDKDLDKMFHDKLYSYELEPSESVWTDIADQLGTKKKKRGFPVLWMAAASLAAVVAAGVWFSSQKEPMKLTGAVGTEAITPKQEAVKSPVKEEGIVENKKKPEAFGEVRADKAKSVVSQPESKIVLSQKSRTSNSSIVQNNSENIASIITEIEKIQHPEEPAIVSSQSQTMALAATPEKAQVIELENTDGQRKQKMIKSVGSLVNFVVGKVDKRKNKIIEFEDGDEGTMVSSLNLGLLKFQAKQ